MSWAGTPALYSSRRLSLSQPTSAQRQSRSPVNHDGLTYLLFFPPAAEEIRKPFESWIQMAGVRSPYLAPLPAPFPPVVMWSTCWNPCSILFVLNSNERYHSLVRDGIVVRRLLFDICCSSWSREYTGIHSSIAPAGYDSGISIFRATLMLVSKLAKALLTPNQRWN